MKNVHTHCNQNTISSVLTKTCTKKAFLNPEGFEQNEVPKDRQQTNHTAVDWDKHNSVCSWVWHLLSLL